MMTTRYTISKFAVALVVLIFSSMVLPTISQAAGHVTNPQPISALSLSTSFATIDADACERLLLQERVLQQNQAATDSGMGDAIKGYVNNSLKNFFTRGSLHYRLSCDPLIVGSTSVYRVAQSLVNFAVLIILIIIAFANILRLKLDTYAVKKSIPLLIFGVVMANLGLPIIRTIVDLAGVLTANFIQQATLSGSKTAFVQELIGAVYQGGTQAVGGVLSRLNTGSSNGWFGPTGFFSIVGITVVGVAAAGPAFLFILLASVVMVLIPAALFFFLGLLFIARIYFLVILAAVSPIAFASLGYEPLKGKLWGWWWSHFIKWTFMTPITFFLFWLGITFFRSVKGEMDIGTYIITLFILWYATQIPLKMGGTVMSQWSKSLVQPIQNSLTKAVSGGQQAIRVAASRRLSQPTKLGGRVVLPPLNVSKISREFLAKRESKFAEDERTSAAAKFGRGLGHVVNTTETGRVLQDTRDLLRGRIPGVDVPEEANTHMNDLMKRFGGNDTRWEDIRDKEEMVKILNKAFSEAIKTSDINKMIGVYMTNAKLGRNLHRTEQRELLEALRKNGVDTNVYETIYQRTFRINQGFSAATAEAGKSDTQVRDEFIVKINSDVGFKQGKEKIETLQHMADKFRYMRDSEGRVLNAKTPTDKKEILRQIETDPTLFGYANAWLTQMDSDPEVRKQLQGNEIYRTLLAGNEGRFMVVDVREQLPKTAQLINTKINPSRARSGLATISPQDLGNGLRFPITAEGWGNLLEPERRAILATYLSDKGIETFKADFTTHLEEELERAIFDLGINYNRLSIQARQYAKEVTQVDNPNKPPEAPTEEGLTRLLAQVGKAELAPQLLERLNTSKLYAESMQQVHQIATQGNLIKKADDSSVLRGEDALNASVAGGRGDTGSAYSFEPGNGRGAGADPEPPGPPPPSPTSTPTTPTTPPPAPDPLIPEGRG